MGTFAVIAAIKRFANIIDFFTFNVKFDSQ